MTKAELVAHLASTAEITKTEAESVLNELATQAREHVEAGEEFSLPDIGKLKVTETAARTGRNPATGESIDIPAGKKVKFHAAKALKDAVA
jgi:DNA-binding protein HU-beta